MHTKTTYQTILVECCQSRVFYLINILYKNLSVENYNRINIKTYEL